jgi:predicted choloylglycine hydrolase
MGCSALIVEPEHSATGGPLFGRNFDFPTLGELDQYSILFIVRPEGRHAFASISFPGAVGVVSGMNDAGLAVATLDVERTADGSARFDAAGTPLALVFRRILEECTTVAEAEALLRAEHATTWMNLAVCDTEGAAVFEITPATIGRRDAENGVLPCTNHFRTEGLTVNKDCWRYALLAETAAHAATRPLDVDAVRQRLDRANQGEETLQTMVFEPRELVLHLAIGLPPTSDDEFVRIPLAPLFAP